MTTDGIIRGIAHGMKDSLAGFLCFHKIDAEIAKQKEKRYQEMLLRRPPTAPPPPFKHLDDEPKVLHRILQCCGWNAGLCLLSIIVFNNAFLPLLHLLTTLILGRSDNQGWLWSWMQPFLSYLFSTLWVIPLFLLGKITNILWFQDIADTSYRKSRGHPPQLLNLSKLLADVLFSIVMQTIFLFQAILMSYVPIKVVSQMLWLLHMCLLHSFYAFEYKWFNMGWELPRRVSHMENNWPYYLGFGLLLATLTSLSPSLVISGCLFSIFFPIFIISGNEAHTHPNYCNFPLQLFSPSIKITNFLFHLTINVKPKKH